MTNTSNEAPPKSDKRRYVREALEDLGLNATKGQAGQWLEKRYGIRVGDPTFYDVRKQMQQEVGQQGKSDGAGQAKEAQPKGHVAPKEAARRPGPEDGAREESGASGQPTPAGAAASPARAEGAGSAPREGVAEMVTVAKGLIERLGKEEVKRLIDAL
jgi:hypothetical protein